MHFLIGFAILCFIIAVPELRAAALVRLPFLCGLREQRVRSDRRRDRRRGRDDSGGQVREMDSRGSLPAIDHLPPLHGRLILRYAIDYICGSDGTAEAGRLVSRGRKRIGMRVSVAGKEQLAHGQAFLDPSAGITYRLSKQPRAHCGCITEEGATK